MNYVIAYFGAGAAFLLLDLLWLGVIARSWYHSQMEGLIASSFNAPGAIAFYLIYLVGVIVFAISPALSSGSVMDAALRGALFGFFCYATYDLTNLAVMRGYPLKLALVDIAWGTVLTGAAAAAGMLAVNKFG